MAHICEFFPCHKLIDGFNCKNCYCPLYDHTDCQHFGGEPKFLYSKGEKIKDCSDCILPHKPDFKIQTRY